MHILKIKQVLKLCLWPSIYSNCKAWKSNWTWLLTQPWIHILIWELILTYHTDTFCNLQLIQPAICYLHMQAVSWGRKPAEAEKVCFFFVFFYCLRHLLRHTNTLQETAGWEVKEHDERVKGHDKWLNIYYSSSITFYSERHLQIAEHDPWPPPWSHIPSSLFFSAFGLPRLCFWQV